eukprot:1961923-Prorocentrum_lima.AAC.1
MRAQLPLDLALMQYTARENAFVDVCMYCWADAAPQAGAGWMVSSYSIVPGQHHVDLAASARLLQQS